MRRKRLSSGFTLIELVLSMGAMALIAIGAARAYQAIARFETEVLPRREQMGAYRRAEDRLAALVRGAYLSDSGSGTPTYFIGVATGQGVTVPALGDLSDTLTFTSTGLRPRGAYVESTDAFEDLNARFGPQGGIAEISLSSVPVGDPGGREGPYLRIQRPADGDFEQGGTEKVLDADIAGVGFDFWDGTTWVAEWDTSTMPEPRLPAAVRITYSLVGEEGTTRVLIVRLPLSDVTPENPATIGGGP